MYNTINQQILKKTTPLTYSTNDPSEKRTSPPLSLFPLLSAHPVTLRVTYVNACICAFHAYVHLRMLDPFTRSTHTRHSHMHPMYYQAAGYCGPCRNLKLIIIPRGSRKRRQEPVRMYVRARANKNDYTALGQRAVIPGTGSL